MAALIKQQITYWLDAGGNRVPPNTRGARRVTRKSKKWYAQGVPGFPPSKRIPLAVSKPVAAKMLEDLINQGERGVAGMPDLSQIRRPLAAHAADFRQHLLDKGGTAKHAHHTHTMVVAIIDGCRWKVIADLNAATVVRWIAEQQRRAAKPFGVETANHYLVAIKSFSAWLAGAAQRTGSDPLRHLSKWNAATDRKRVRRALTIEQVNSIIHAARASVVVYRGMTGPARAVLYLTAAMTGFRRSELATLTPKSFRLDSDPPVVELPPRVAKNRKVTAQPIPVQLADAVREYAAGKPATAPLWPGTWSDRSAAMLRIDLVAAGVPYVVADEVADFHSLRHSFITWLVAAGANPKQAQTLARHSTVELTIGRYTHTNQAELGVVVSRLTGQSAGGTEGEIAALHRLILALAERVADLTEIAAK